MTNHSVKLTMEFVTADICKVGATFIVNPCNCVTDKPFGTTAAIFEAFPYANIYKARDAKSKKKDPVGKIVLCGKGTPEEPYVINMLNQIYPGPPKWKTDSPELRKKWTVQCLADIINLAEVKAVQNGTIALPANMGYWLLGEKWEEFNDLITKFGKASNLKVLMIKSEGNLQSGEKRPRDEVDLQWTTSSPATKEAKEGDATPVAKDGLLPGFPERSVSKETTQNTAGGTLAELPERSASTVGAKSPPPQPTDEKPFVASTTSDGNSFFG